MGKYKSMAVTAAITVLISGGVVYAANNVKAAKFLKEKAVA